MPAALSTAIADRDRLRSVRDLTAIDAAIVDHRLHAVRELGLGDVRHTGRTPAREAAR